MTDHIVRLSTDINGVIIERGLDKEGYFVELTEDAEKVRANHLMQIEFPKAELEAILDLPGCIGIRLHPAFNSQGEPSLSVNGIGIGSVSSNKVESSSIDQILDLTIENFPDIGLTENKSYISEGMTAVSRGNEAQRNRDHNIISKMIILAKGQGIDGETLFPFSNPFNADYGNHTYLIPSVIFSSQVVRNLLKEDVVGLRFRTIKMQISLESDFKNTEVLASYKTLTVAPIYHSEEEGTMILSALPCPPNCAGGGDGDSPHELDTM